MTAEKLENRLIDFAVDCIKLTNDSIKSFAANHLNTQLIRSGTSAPLNYSESIGAGSHKDYIHKMQIVLKELRESKTNLIIQQRAKLNDNSDKLNYLIDESHQLILIFSKSIATSKKNQHFKNK